MTKAVMRGEHRRWRETLRDAPTWALEDEMARRVKEMAPAPIRLPGVVVDPLHGSVEWRGEWHLFGGRDLEVLYALAVFQQQGRRSVLSGYLADQVFRGFDESAKQSLRVYVWRINKRVPGLIVKEWRPGSKQVGYGLALDDAKEAA